MDLLRFSTAGSVDNGKSMLIGRLLHDAKSIFEDQYNSLVRTTARRGGVGGNVDAVLDDGVAVDLALLTDGLIAEREQGITIDVAYRYFSTPERKFIIADTPGHEQYTRNMVTGASTADLTIVLVDAGKGVLPQSRRHAAIASLLGIRHVVFAINKMDLVDYDQIRFDTLKHEIQAIASKLSLRDVRCIPVSALRGDMVVERGARLDWYYGPTLLDHLESVDVSPAVDVPFRFPVQLVSRPGLPADRPDAYVRGYMGRIESGAIRTGDRVVVQPGGRKTRVKSIVTLDGTLTEAHAPQSITLLLDDEIDISRGDLIVRADATAAAVKSFDATLCWMDAQALLPSGRYLIKHTTRTTKAMIDAVTSKLDIATLELRDTIDEAARGELTMNEIARVRIRTRDPLMVDAYMDNRATGAFILIDEVSNHTVAAGMIVRLEVDDAVDDAVDKR
ncbi:MAG: sulfate adenylyltransferase subunit 1 [Burkholderiaceae bacterium]